MAPRSLAVTVNRYSPWSACRKGLAVRSSPVDTCREKCSAQVPAREGRKCGHLEKPRRGRNGWPWPLPQEGETKRPCPRPSSMPAHLNQKGCFKGPDRKDPCLSFFWSRVLAWANMAITCISRTQQRFPWETPEEPKEQLSYKATLDAGCQCASVPSVPFRGSMWKDHFSCDAYSGRAPLRRGRRLGPALLSYERLIPAVVIEAVIAIL